MLKSVRSPLAQFGLAVVLATGLAAVLFPASIRSLFSSGMFMPHIHCYLDDPRMVWLQGLSDSLIGIAYMGISGALAYLVYKARHDIPFEWMFLAFGVFIFSCGWTHFLEVWTLWHPTYWLSGTIKALTAVASVATGVGIIPLLPRAFGLIETAKVSEQRRQELEAAHRELEAMNRKLRELDALKSRFFANVSHELRTPLALILGHTERLREALNLTADQQRSLAVLERNGLVLHEQVNNLLDAAKLESGQMQLHYAQTDLATLVRLVCSNFESLANEHDLRFTIEAPPTLPAQADLQKLEQVLVNLLSNAFKFTPRGGRVRCSLREARTEALLEVADSGPGVPAAARAAVFERFRQLDKSDSPFGGTGLGLCIAKDFVELHGGKLEIGDSPEGGALFNLRLPRNAPAGAVVQPASSPASATPGIAPARRALAQLTSVPPLSAPAALPADQLLGVRPSPGAAAPIPSPVLRAADDHTDQHIPAPADGRTPLRKYPTRAGNGQPVVLIIEDNAEMIELIQDTLRPDYRTIPASNGAEGLDKARRTPPDLILTDLMMPEMSGEEFLHQVRAERSLDPVPVVVLTARADERVRVQLLREGAQDYLLKPFTREELRARAGNLVAAKLSRQNLECANHELEAFSYSLAHDLTGPLRSIRTFAQLLSDEYAPTLQSEAGVFLQNIIKSSNRLDQLVTDVLAYTRMERAPARQHPVDLEALLRGIIEETPDFRPPKAEIHLRAPLHRVLGYEAALTQVAVNLLSNAVKFVPPGAQPHIEIWTEPLDDHVRIWFEDHGIGIDPKDHERLFGLFQRLHNEREYPGTGLGLAIVRKAVERMGGTLGLESALGQGCRFWLDLKSPP